MPGYAQLTALIVAAAAAASVVLGEEHLLPLALIAALMGGLLGAAMCAYASTGRLDASALLSSRWSQCFLAAYAASIAALLVVSMVR